MDCIALLQWALPQLDLQWSGFRKVRRQVCKRLKRRITELQLDNFAAYRARLAVNPAEWIIFDQCCHITISRFFRDKGLFETVRRRLLPEIAVRAKREQRDARIWSAGCASGEEPYSLKILWDLEIADLFPEVSVSIIATDIDNTMLARAREGCFKATSLRDFPPHLLGQAFDHVGSLFCIRPRHRKSDRIPASGFAAGDANVHFRSHLVPLCCIHVLCAVAAKQDFDSNPGSAFTRRLSRNWGSRARSSCRNSVIAAG
jgi:chemotaxis protein methyltransferase CheR